MYILIRSITRACDTLGTLDQGMVDAVDARQEVDLRIGRWVWFEFRIDACGLSLIELSLLYCTLM